MGLDIREFTQPPISTPDDEFFDEFEDDVDDFFMMEMDGGLGMTSGSDPPLLGSSGPPSPPMMANRGGAMDGAAIPAAPTPDAGVETPRPTVTNAGIATGSGTSRGVDTGNVAWDDTPIMSGAASGTGSGSSESGTSGRDRQKLGADTQVGGDEGTDATADGSGSGVGASSITSVTQTFTAAVLVNGSNTNASVDNDEDVMDLGARQGHGDSMITSDMDHKTTNESLMAMDHNTLAPTNESLMAMASRQVSNKRASVNVTQNLTIDVPTTATNAELRTILERVGRQLMQSGMLTHLGGNAGLSVGDFDLAVRVEFLDRRIRALAEAR